MTLLALCVAFLDAIPLARSMQTFGIIQTLALVGVDGARNLPAFKQEISQVSR
jgi:hypothetical protein